MKKVVKKLTGILVTLALVVSLCSMLSPQDVGAYSSGTVNTWEPATETLTMTGGLGITGAQSGGSYTEDPWNSGHGVVYRLHAVSSPGAQIGRDKSALEVDNHAFRMEGNTKYRITFDYMWGANSTSSIEADGANFKIGLVWGEQLNGGTNRPRAKFHDENVLTLDNSNSTTATVEGHTVRKLTSDTKWATYSHEFETSASAGWNSRYTSLLIQNNCDNGEGPALNDAVLYFDNVKIEKLVNTSAKNKPQVVWTNATEILHLENGMGITGCQGNVGQYTIDPRNEGHGTVYKVSSISSNSFQIGRDNNAVATDTDAFKMEAGVTYKLSFDFMWGKGSTSSVADGVGQNEIALVWGSQLNGGTNTPRSKFLGGLDYYILDDSNSTLTTIGDYPARVQTVDSEWMHTEYIFTTDKNAGHGWRDHFVTLMIQNNCDNGSMTEAVNNAHLYVDNIVIKQASYITSDKTPALIGDANLDGAVTSADAITCLYGVVFGDNGHGYNTEALCDYDSDDTVTSSDAVYLLYNYAFGNEKYPIRGNSLNGSLTYNNVHYLDADGNLVYRVVYPSSGSMNSANVAKTVSDTMRMNLGQTVSCVSDSQSGSTAYEILVGNTNRPESKEAMSYLYDTGNGRTEDFVICTINNKIVINAQSESALAKACNYFNSVIFNNKGNLGGIKYVYFAEKGKYTEAKVNGIPISRFKIINAHYNSSYIVTKEIKSLIETAIGNTGYRLDSFDDTLSETKYEIIIGETNRSGETALVNKDSFDIKIDGTTVYINGGSIQSTAMGISEFGKLLKKGNLSNRDSVSGSYAEAVEDYDLSNRYSLTWSDDFELDSSDDNRDVINGIDYTKWWVYRPGEGYDADSRNGRTMIRSWDADVVHSEGGKLHIHSKFDNNYYYGARLATVYTMAYKYGYAEMSAIMPEGSAFWIAFWGSSYADSGSVFGTEVDIFEYFGDTGMEMGKCNLHGWMKDGRLSTYNSQYASGKWVTLDEQNHWALHDFDKQLNHGREVWHPEHSSGGRLYDEFHTYGYLWTPERVDFTFDGEVYLSLDLTSNPVWADTMQDYQYLIVSEAVCSLARTTTRMDDNDPRWATNNFDIDYVHVYQLQDGQSGLLLGGAKP